MALSIGSSSDQWEEREGLIFYIVVLTCVCVYSNTAPKQIGGGLFVSVTLRRNIMAELLENQNLVLADKSTGMAGKSAANSPSVSPATTPTQEELKKAKNQLGREKEKEEEGKTEKEGIVPKEEVEERKTQKKHIATDEDNHLSVAA